MNSKNMRNTITQNNKEMILQSNIVFVGEIQNVQTSKTLESKVTKIH